MSRYTSIDIRDKIIDILNNGGTDVNTTFKSMNDNLTDIDALRGTNTLRPLLIDYKWNFNQTPFVLVEMGRSDILNEEQLTDNYELVTEVYECLVMFEIKTVDNQCQDMVENYIDAIIKCLHGYSDCNIQWILATETDRENVYQKANETLKAGMVRFEIRIN